jgi:hypothetical protein
MKQPFLSDYLFVFYVIDPSHLWYNNFTSHILGALYNGEYRFIT